ncbi:hypothetical protein [Haloparvum sedimenti]|uniref:hypothetical protein n=1 Tax=Haloparvum sedimenti TaxID=1678448 RepID=UPI00071E747F|nr:hypothetical protein [Haloparvum sedimenti]
MNALLDFVVRVVGDVGRLGGVFVEQVLANGDPISIAVFVVGQLFMVGAIAALGYAALGALLSEIGVDLPALGAGVAK